jgi:hypothetical protein
MPNAYRTNTASPRAFQIATQDYLLRLIYEEGLNPDFSTLQRAGATVNDFLTPDVVAWTSLAGIEAGRAQLVVAPGQEAQAQRLYDAIANRTNFFGPPIVGDVNTVGLIQRVSSHYGPLWRYGIFMGRGTLFRAYNIGANCSKTRTITGLNGQPQLECDFDALLILRRTFRLRVTGERVEEDDFKR